MCLQDAWKHSKNIARPNFPERAWLSPNDFAKIGANRTDMGLEMIVANMGPILDPKHLKTNVHSPQLHLHHLIKLLKLCATSRGPPACPLAHPPRPQAAVCNVCRQLSGISAGSFQALGPSGPLGPGPWAQWAHVGSWPHLGLFWVHFGPIWTQLAPNLVKNRKKNCPVGDPRLTESQKSSHCLRLHHSADVAKSALQNVNLQVRSCQ